jgi:hypothetical protein
MSPDEKKIITNRILAASASASISAPSISLAVFLNGIHRRSASYSAKGAREEHVLGLAR